MVDLAVTLIYVLFRELGLSTQEGYDAVCKCKADIEKICLERNESLTIQ